MLIFPKQLVCWNNSSLISRKILNLLSNPGIFENANGTLKFFLGRVPPVALAPKTLNYPL